MKKQGASARMDESLGMRRGKESSKSQSYKSRRDESYGASKPMGKLKDGTQASAPSAIKVPCGEDWAKVKPFRSGNLGYPSQAFDYKY